MLNMVALMGRLTFEPELRQTQSGISVVNFQVACDRNYQAQGKERQADFIDCQAWRGTAEFIDRYFHKGDMIAIEGRIETNNFTDRFGNNRKAVTVSVVNVSFCGSKQNNTNLDVEQQQDEQFQEILDDDADYEEIIDYEPDDDLDEDDDLPF